MVEREREKGISFYSIHITKLKNWEIVITKTLMFKRVKIMIPNPDN